MPKAKAGEALDVASRALVDLAGDIEMEETIMDYGDDGKEPEDDDGEEGLLDPYNEMSEDKQHELNITVRPVQLALVKVSLSSNFNHELYTHTACPNLATKTRICNQKLFNNPTSLLGLAPWWPCK